MNATEACLLTESIREQHNSKILEILPLAIDREAKLGHDTVKLEIQYPSQVDAVKKWCKKHSTDTHVFVVYSHSNDHVEILWRRK